jgi:hypothetical protein
MRRVILDAEVHVNYLLWGWYELDKKVHLPLTESELPWIEKTEERPRWPQRAQPQETGLPLPLGAGRVVAYSAGRGLE